MSASLSSQFLEFSPTQKSSFLTTSTTAQRKTHMKSAASLRRFAFITLVSHLTTLNPFLGRISSANASPNILEGLKRSQNYTRADEYYSELYQGEILVPIHLLGAVGKPGVYHIPKQTDIIRLLALAGGTRADANLEDVYIKRRSEESERVISLNLKQLVNEKGSGRPINLEANDVVLVSPKEPILSNNTLQVVGFAASLLGLIVSSLVIVNQLKK